MVDLIVTPSASFLAVLYLATDDAWQWGTADAANTITSKEAVVW